MRNGDIKENDAHGTWQKILAKHAGTEARLFYRAAERPKDNILPKDFFNEISVTQKYSGKNVCWHAAEGKRTMNVLLTLKLVWECDCRIHSASAVARQPEFRMKKI